MVHIATQLVLAERWLQASNQHDVILHSKQDDNLFSNQTRRSMGKKAASLFIFILYRRSKKSAATLDRLAVSQETAVVSHHQMGLHLSHGIDGHTHHNQKRGATEVEWYIGLGDENGGQHTDG